MGESKRRKQILGDRYGIPDINAQVQSAWTHIDLGIERARENGTDYLIIQCSNDDKGFDLDAIALVKKEIEHWKCELNIAILIQMLPRGFNASESKLFDGFITVWCNCPEFKLWQALFDTKIEL